jgi:recombination protein RecR
MTPGFENLLKGLKSLPGLGHRSAERIALHLLVEKPEGLDDLIDILRTAGATARACSICGNLSEDDTCSICADEEREVGGICIVERVPDLFAIERSGAYRGRYHVLHGKLSPIRGIGPEKLNFASLRNRIEKGEVNELILAIANDIEGEATCHYLSEEIVGDRDIKLSRIGFGIPSGSGVTYADEVTLRSALDARRDFS